MKIVTMYLPQFHRIAENDAWWGEGFTEWVAASSARPLYKGHEQPKAPLNNNYYDLLNHETMRWQAKLMHQYGVYGQCFYHYYFKDGRKVLEKPAENLLKWKNINMPFCFCWANESWARSWSNLTEKNVWSPRGEDEEERKKNPSGVLLEQKYGGEIEWKKHYEYLRPFFQDSRYIRLEGKPIFLIFQPSLIPCIQQMLHCWNSMAEMDGLGGMYFVSMNAFKIPGFQTYLYHEPQYTLMHAYPRENVNADKKIRRHVEYEDVWNKIIRRSMPESKEKLIQGGFTGYDDTPRRGTGGSVIGQTNPQIFRKMLSKLLRKNEDRGNEITFLNAWNEWGEGMYLEPDAKDGYAYLEAVKWALEHYQEEKSESFFIPDRTANESEKLVERYQCYWRVLHQWMLLKENGVSIGQYLYQKRIRKVAVYGMGMLGLHLVKELEGGPVEILCGIDRAAGALHQVFPIMMPGEPIGEVDAVIITPVYAFDEIYSTLRKNYQGKILSLMELVTNAE